MENQTEIPQPPTPEQHPPDLKEVMTSAMAKLEAKNKELGGHLFGVFGGDEESKVLLFSTPLIEPTNKEEDDLANIYSLLAVTKGGFKILRLDNKSNTDNIIERIKERQSDYKEFSYYPRDGFFDEESPHRAFIGIKTNNQHLLFYKGGELGMSLVENPEPDRVAEIIKLNIDRIASEKEAEAQKQKEYEEKVKPHLEVAQRLDEVLA